MKKITFLLLSITLLACGPNYYLKRSRINMYKAIAMGAKVDTTWTIKRDTIRTRELVDSIVREARIDTATLFKDCPEARKSPEIRHQIQKAVCPDVIKDTVYNVEIDVQGDRYKFPIHVYASSVAGETELKIEAKPFKVPFKEKEGAINVSPRSEGLRWYHLLISFLIALLVGYVAGNVAPISNWRQRNQ